MERKKLRTLVLALVMVLAECCLVFAGEAGTVFAAESSSAGSETAAVTGAMQLTASIDGAAVSYGSRADRSMVWVPAGATGKQITLKATVSNIAPGTDVKFIWTSQNTTTPIAQHPGMKVAAGTTSVTDSFTVTPGAGIYAYFCVVEIPSETQENKNANHTLVYVVKDPLVINTKDESVHIAPETKSLEKSGMANMDVYAKSMIPGDSFKSPFAPDWNTSDQYDSWSVKMISEADAGILHTQAALTGIDGATTIVTCSLSSKYSPSDVYGMRRVTFTIDTDKHIWTKWNVMREATIWQTGLVEHECKECGYVEDQELEKLKPSIKHNAKAIPMKAGTSTKAYKVTLAEGDTLTWSSSNRSVCTVSGSFTGTCTIYARKVGVANIIATAKSGKKISVRVVVTKKKVRTKAILGLPKYIVVNRNESKALEPQLYPLTSQYPVIYKSLKPAIAKVNKDGEVVGVTPGRCKIKVTSGNVTKYVWVFVPGVDATKILNVKSAYTLRRGRYRTLRPTLSPANATSKFVFKSSNRKVATVNSKGKVVAKKKGTAIITVYAVNVMTKSIAKKVTITVK